MTVRMRALTDGANMSAVLWKHHNTIPPLLKMLKRSNILFGSQLSPSTAPPHTSLGYLTTRYFDRNVFDYDHDCILSVQVNSKHTSNSNIHSQLGEGRGCHLDSGCKKI